MAVRLAGTHPRPFVFGDVIRHVCEENCVPLMVIGHPAGMGAVTLTFPLDGRSGILMSSFLILNEELSQYELLT